MTGAPGPHAAEGVVSPAHRGIREGVVVLALAALVAGVSIHTITPWPIGAFQDDAIYTVLGRALATGEGYRLTNLPGAPHATHFPPGYPLVLAALWRLAPEFPRNMAVFKFANAAFAALAAVGAYRFLRARGGATVPGAAALALTGTLSIAVLLITGVVMSEPLFMALLFPVLGWAERAVARGGARDALVAGAGIGGLAMVRTLGAFALPGLVLLLLWRRRPWAAAAACAGAALCLGPWQAWVQAYQGEIPPVLAGKYGAYGPWLADGYREGGVRFAGEVVTRNVRELALTFSNMLLPVHALAPKVAVAIGLAAALVAGAWRLARRMPATVAFLAAYGGVMLLWPFEPTRFVLAVWPLVVPVAAAGVGVAWGGVPAGALARLRRGAVATVVAVVTAGYGWYNANGYARRWWESIQRDAGTRARPTIAWVLRYTAAGDVLATDDDLLVYLYTGRRSVPTSTFLAREYTRPLAPAETEAAVRAILDTYRPAYFVSGSRDMLAAARSLAAATPPRLRVLGATRSAQIFVHLRP